MTRRNKIFVIGDTHGFVDLGKLSRFAVGEGKNLTREDYVIVLGDVGIFWAGNVNHHQRMVKKYESYPWTTLFIDGNHDEIPTLYGLEKVLKFNSVVGKVSPHIFHLRRGHVYNILRRSFWVMGGALSTDIGKRTLGVSYWTEELPSHKEENFGVDSLEDYAWTVDYILTHTAPSMAVETFMDGRVVVNTDPLEKYLQYIKDHATFDDWYCGHFHVDKKIENIHCVYNEILELE